MNHFTKPFIIIIKSLSLVHRDDAFIKYFKPLSRVRKKQIFKLFLNNSPFLQSFFLFCLVCFFFFFFFLRFSLNLVLVGGSLIAEILITWNWYKFKWLWQQRVTNETGSNGCYRYLSYTFGRSPKSTKIYQVTWSEISISAIIRIN